MAAASEHLSAAEVARLLNRFGAKGFQEDVHTLLEDYFVFREDDDDAESDAEPTPSSSQDVYAPSTSSADVASSGGSEQLRAIFVDTTEADTVHPVVTDDADDKLNEFLSASCGCARNCVQLFSRDMIKQSMLDTADLDLYCNEHINHQHLILYTERAQASIKGGNPINILVSRGCCVSQVFFVCVFLW